MGKKAFIYIGITVIALGLLMVLQYNKPKKLNWYPSYVASHKIPYGTYVFNKIMPELFPEKVVQVHLPPFEFLNNESQSGTYLFINNEITFNKTELEALLEWTATGNTLFVASKSFETDLLDTLHLKTRNVYSGFEVVQKQLHTLVNPVLKVKDSILFDKTNNTSYFSKIDTLRTVALGTVTTSTEEGEGIEKINLIRQPFGKGKIILSTFPQAFTNYFLLKDNNKEHTAGLLSYLEDSENIFLDNHYKSGKSFYTSPMHIFLNTKELKWAYYIALIGALICVVFEGKRKQRAVPVVHPLKNQTLAFTRTISDMYYEKGDQKAIAEHRIQYFMDYIRSKYYLGSIKKEDDFHNNLAGRSGHSLDFIQSLFSFLEKLRNAPQVSDNELIQLNKFIQKFKSEIDGK